MRQLLRLSRNQYSSHWEATESSRGLTWYANTEEAGQVQYAKAADMVNGEFPAEYAAVDATVIPANDEGFYSNQAVLSNLEESTEYVYRVVNGDTVSDVYNFSTGSYDSSFSFAFVGRPPDWCREPRRRTSRDGTRRWIRSRTIWTSTSSSPQGTR